MTKTFERFLRSFSDEELVRFAQERAAALPPYWRAMRLALRIESDRRGLSFEDEGLGAVVASDPERPTRGISA